MSEAEQLRLIAVWVIFTVVSLVGAIAVLVWAVRARQFSRQDRARWLPLESGIPRDDSVQPDVPGQEPKA
jgi:hypothetical protein